MIKINLLPPEIQKKAKRKRLIRLIGLSGLLIVLIIFAIYSQKFLYCQKLTHQLKTIELELKKIEPIVKEIEQRQKEKELLTKKYQVMKDLMRNSLLYPRFLEELVIILPDNVWFTNLTTKSTPDLSGLEVNLDASALDNYATADFLTVLEKRGSFSNIELGTIQKGGSEKEPLFSFRLTFRYQP